VQERIEQAQADMHLEMDAVEARIDDTIQALMENMVAQLTKLEEMQSMVLNANFESVNKYMKTVEKKLKIVAKVPEVEKAARNVSESGF